MAAVHLYHLLRLLVMGYKCKHLDYPLSGTFALDIPQVDADKVEGCEEPRRELTVLRVGN